MDEATMNTAANLSSAQVCAASGATYRQLDYWCRTGRLCPAVPAAGSGSARRWTVEQARLARAAVVLADLGARTGALVEAMAALDAYGWTGQVVVCPSGQVCGLEDWSGDAGWTLDLFAVRMHVEMRLARPLVHA